MCEREREFVRERVCEFLFSCVRRQVHASWRALARIHAVLGIPTLSPTKAAEAIERIKKLREQHRTEHCSTMDLHEDLPLVREAIFKMENKPWSKNRAKQHRNWARFLYPLEHAHRYKRLSLYLCVMVCVCKSMCDVVCVQWRVSEGMCRVLSRDRQKIIVRYIWCTPGLNPYI